MEVLVGKTLTTTGLVEYQSGSIVSRTIVDGAGGDVTLFAIAPGEGLSEHTSTRHALALVLEGRAHFTVGEEKMEAGPGDSIAMPANVPHALEAPVNSGGFKMMLCLVKP